MIDSRPTLIARCAETSDVVEAVRAARWLGLEIAPKPAPDNSKLDGGILIDLSPIREAAVDVEGRRARIGGGALLTCGRQPTRWGWIVRYRAESCQ